MLTRRGFLRGSAAVAGLGLAGGRLASARGLLVPAATDALIASALTAARRAGASYADVRLHRRRAESVTTREDRVIGTSASESYGVAVRVLAGGAWGFAATSRVEAREAARIAARAVEMARANARVVKRPVALAPNPAHVDVWQTPILKDPFKIALEDKAELLLAINREAQQVPGVKFVTSWYYGAGEWKLFASSEGAFIEQDQIRVGPGYSVTAVDDKGGTFESRDHDLPPAQAGWEYVEGSSLLADARRVGEDAVTKLKAGTVTPGKKDVVLAPSNLWLTIHESVGHATELDRALGYEANFAGTSFATVDKLGKLRYASPIVSLYADKTQLPGLATCGYDDDGVETQRWDLVKDGTLVGYQTTREQAAWIGEAASRGSAYAEDFSSVPFQRMPNVSLAPGPKELQAEDLIAATDDGVYVIGTGSWSIDQQRLNFQFGGDMFYEIKKGKLGRPLKEVAYQSNTLDFWRACDLLGGRRAWALFGTLSDGKGQPVQSNAVSHGCPPARFRGVNVLATGGRS